MAVIDEKIIIKENKRRWKGIIRSAEAYERQYVASCIESEYLYDTLNKREDALNKVLSEVYDIINSATPDMTLFEKEKMYNDLKQAINK